MKISLRPTGVTDQPFLRELFWGLRKPEFLPLGLPDDQLTNLLDQQFFAQRHHYATAYPEAEDQIVLMNGDPIGNWIVAELPREIRLIDITLSPGQRGMGIGSDLIRGLLARASDCSKPVVLHVEMANPARRLYDRFGFIEEAEVGVYWRMRWAPN